MQGLPDVLFLGLGLTQLSGFCLCHVMYFRSHVLGSVYVEPEIIICISPLLSLRSAALVITNSFYLKEMETATRSVFKSIYPPLDFLILFQGRCNEFSASANFQCKLTFFS